MEVPVVLVGALASLPRTRMSRGFHLIAQHGPWRASTFAAFAGFRPTIIHGGIDATVQRRISHGSYFVYSPTLPPVSGGRTMMSGRH